MNSPVSCLPDPIQNMAPKLAKKKIQQVQARAAPRKMAIPPQMRYSKTAPAAMGGITTKANSALPVLAGAGRKMVVQNYELIDSLKGNATDTFSSLLSSYTCNPGIAAFVPWLSTVALNYSKFRWTYLRFLYVPKVPTNVPGQAFIDISYDFTDSQPASVADVAVSDSSSIGPVWIGGGINTEKAFRADLGVDEAIFVDVDCRSFTQPYFYIRKQAGVDADSHPCVLYFGSAAALTGVGAYGATGDIYVAYKCELFEPVQPALNN